MKTTYKLCTILFFSLTIIVNAQAQQVSAALSNKSNQDSAHVFLAGLVGTDALNLSSVTASGGLQIGAIVGKFSGFISYNFSSAVSKPQQADSVPLSSVFFTDEGSSAFSERLDYTLWKKDMGIKGSVAVQIGEDASLQRKNITKDSINYPISIINQTYGIRFLWAYSNPKTNDRLTFIASLLLENVQILPNSKQSFDVVFGTNGKSVALPQIYNGLCGMVETHINSLVLYCRMFNTFNSIGSIEVPNSFAFTVGI